MAARRDKPLPDGIGAGKALPDGIKRDGIGRGAFATLHLPL